ncbi:tripartite tricarboxylate transporter TctB family protein [Acidaminobacter hydrogenoformans]|uniref:Tripartite tricarboxylate transporter TctB family protein n=1 Tax=Acidaminobacter hydrogenoformans DSM 2784 TaxID=1120920 RepID=A0A1G5RXM8_9FIRM|nr:tripartite tricarboxylate transporter TctB family protein [Acidaminobacter hydrogenoformans]SCZ78667.1 Tripartite tricarboxylate transporter TctB family protein [Acidaminobacter hydrogenoformans DSM 2784]
MKDRQGNLLFYALLIILGIFMEFLIIPNFIKQRANVDIGPEVFPQLITGILIVLSIAGFIMEYRALKKEGGSFKGYKIMLKSYFPHFLFLLSGLIFLILAPKLGFVVAAIPFMFFTLWLFGSEKKLLNLILSVTYPVVLFLIFTQVLRINFPAGIFGI